MMINYEKYNKIKKQRTNTNYFIGIMFYPDYCNIVGQKIKPSISAKEYQEYVYFAKGHCFEPVGKEYIHLTKYPE